MENDTLMWGYLTSCLTEFPPLFLPNVHRFVSWSRISFVCLLPMLPQPSQSLGLETEKVKDG